MTAIKNKLWVLSGPPRSGKSTWAREKAEELSSVAVGCPIVSGDSLRRCLYQRRFWMPGENLIHSYAWIMVRALFLAGHQNVIIDDTNPFEQNIDYWRCGVAATTPTEGGSAYPPLLPVDKIDDEVTKTQQSKATVEDFEKYLAAELQGDVIAWRRCIVHFRVKLDECVTRASELRNYNQRVELIKFIEDCGAAGGWNLELLGRSRLMEGESRINVDVELATNLAGGLVFREHLAAEGGPSSGLQPRNSRVINP